MSLQNRVEKMSFAHRDVKISLDGTLVMQREEALAAVRAASDAVRAAGKELANAQNTESADDRLGKTPEHPELEEAVRAASEEMDAAVARVNELEQQMLADVTTFRVTAMRKDRFNELMIETQGKSAALYSAIARASITYINDEGIEEPIAAELWDQLEPAMTHGQWAILVAAIDELNVTAGRERTDFLGRGLQKTQR